MRKNWFCFVSPPPTRVALRQPYALPATATVTVTATVPVTVTARERQSFNELTLVSFHRHMFASHCLLFVTPPLICLLLYLGPVALGITSWQVTSNCPAKLQARLGKIGLELIKECSNTISSTWDEDTISH